jgi:hypothetical protein
MENQSTSEYSIGKEFIKSIKLCESPLTVIISIDNCIVIGDENGRIKFYDKELKILFWCPSHDYIDSIVGISFDLSTSQAKNEGDSNFLIRDFLIREY